MGSVNLSFRTHLGVRVSKVASRTLKVLSLGEGATLPGKVLLAIAPNALEELSAGLSSVLISGTNAKTTTTALAMQGLGVKYEVISNITGANMREGIAFSLAADGSRGKANSIGLFEVDERYLASIGEVLKTKVIALLNLSRDQLDRVSETRMTSLSWRDFLQLHKEITVVANCDDPLIVYAAEVASEIIWVEAGLNFKFDARSCPKCGGEIDFRGDDWVCECGFRRPKPSILRSGESLRIDGKDVILDMNLPGGCNVANAAMALGVCKVTDVDIEHAAKMISGLSEVAGRYKRISFLGHRVRMLLTKNPAGWVEVFDLIGDDKSVVVGINARVADGRDPSWLWDVPFERLVGKEVFATGERASDLSVRLHYAGVHHQVIFDQKDAVSSCSNEDVSYVGNYTSFQEFRRGVDLRTNSPQMIARQLFERVFK